MIKNIDIIGIGVDGFNTLTLQATDIITKATFVIGARRMVEIVQRFNLYCSTQELIAPSDIFDAIVSSHYSDIVVLMSGDTGFHSGATKLYNLLEDNNSEQVFNTNIHAGISSLQYFSAKIKRSWQGVALHSAHGVDCNFIGEVLTNKECFFLVGGSITATSLVNKLFEVGFTGLTVYIGENLGYENEKITIVTSKVDFEIDKLSVVWVVRPDYYIDSYTGMLSDDDFIRGKVPITKSAVRNHVISLIGRQQKDLVLYDVGSGTGSIAIELALSNPMSTVYAFEVNSEALQLISQNREKFQAYNLVIVEGQAPTSFESELIASPDKVFIGGSKGNMESIFNSLLQKKSCYIVVSAIAVETFASTIAIFKEKNLPNFEVVQLAVAHTKEVGSYNMLMGENPTFLISGDYYAE